MIRVYLPQKKTRKPGQQVAKLSRNSIFHIPNHQLMWQKVKYYVYGAIALVIIYNACFRSPEMEEVPTQGLITTVTEVEPEKFKIEDEQTVQDTNDSRIIAKYLNGNIDTFTLAEARLVQSAGFGAAGVAGMAMQAATFGFLGYMMGRAMTSRPSAGAYTNQGTYDRVNNTTGNSIRSTTARVPKGRSGFGGGRSTRSFGG
jgi:hypothetical protein